MYLTVPNLWSWLSSLVWDHPSVYKSAWWSEMSIKPNHCSCSFLLSAMGLCTLSLGLLPPPALLSLINCVSLSPGLSGSFCPSALGAKGCSTHHGLAVLTSENKHVFIICGHKCKSVEGESSDNTLGYFFKSNAYQVVIKSEERRKQLFEWVVKPRYWYPSLFCFECSKK